MIKQILSVEQSHSDNELAIDHVEVSQVCPGFWMAADAGVGAGVGVRGKQTRLLTVSAVDHACRPGDEHPGAANEQRRLHQRRDGPHRGASVERARRQEQAGAVWVSL